MHEARGVLGSKFESGVAAALQRVRDKVDEVSRNRSEKEVNKKPHQGSSSRHDRRLLSS